LFALPGQLIASEQQGLRRGHVVKSAVQGDSLSVCLAWQNKLVTLSSATCLQVSNSGPFVAGELDPAEIEICRDAEGRKVVLGEGAFGRVS
jgi:hypothetical protein